MKVKENPEFWVDIRTLTEDNLPKGVLVVVTLVTHQNSLTLDGFPLTYLLTCFFRYGTGHERKSEQLDTDGKKKKQRL